MYPLCLVKLEELPFHRHAAVGTGKAMLQLPELMLQVMGLAGYELSISLRCLPPLSAPFVTRHYPPQREKLMPARIASHCGQPQPAAQRRHRSWNFLRGDPLQFVVAANSAARIQKTAKR